MDPPPAPPPDPPVTTAVSVPPSASPIGCPESVDSSPRSRNTDSWDEQLAAVSGGGGGGGGSKLRLMCSYGGHIVPRPHDKSLCYVGGDTRIVVTYRHSSLADLTARLSRTLLGGGCFTLKYQLPNEDLDSLISVTTDEDLENMIDEYDRTTSSHKLSRLRLFLFPSNPDSASSIGSLLDNSTKSEEWFLNTLNGAGVLSRGFSESQSGNCLLSLDNDGGVAMGGGGVAAAVAEGLGLGLGLSRDTDVHVKTVKLGQDVHSMPDSPMLETTSSFGSTSSSPSMANLPPIRVHVVEDGGGGYGVRLHDHKVGIDEQFAQMSVAPPPPAAGQKQDEGGSVILPSPPAAVPAVSVGSAAISGEYPSRVMSDDERSDQGVPIGYWKPPQPLPQPQLVQVATQFQQKASGGGGGLDLPSPDSVSSDNSLTNAMSRSKPAIYQDPVSGQLHSGANRVSANRVDPMMNIYDPNSRVPLLQQVQDPTTGYVLTSQFDQHQQQPQPPPPPPQFLHPGTHYIHHQPTGPVQFSSYYPLYPSQQQHQQHHPAQLDQPYPLYFLPARPGQAYNLSMPQSNLSEAAASTMLSGVPQAPSAAYNQTRSATPPQSEMAAARYRTGTAGTPPLVQMPSSQHQQQFVGFPQIHHTSQSVAPTSTAAANYAYEFSDPAHAQIYYSQALAPARPSQYQTMTTSPNAVLSETATHMQADNIKQ